MKNPPETIHFIPMRRLKLGFGDVKGTGQKADGSVSE
jgi:hypothetical protein